MVISDLLQGDILFDEDRLLVLLGHHLEAVAFDVPQLVPHRRADGHQLTHVFPFDAIIE